jgi:large subunit ribosomal protein L19|tara:strand:- start:57 stop:458 length:402 start_codon:yes stop_codon:yes gene_type:complete
MNTETKVKISNDDLIKSVESKYLKEINMKSDSSNTRLEVGDILRIGYTIYEGSKERVQYYEGVVIAKQNRGLGKSFTIRRSVQGIGIEQVFLLNSPKIVSITKKQSSKVRRAKLYFLRGLTGKATRLKRKFQN